MLQRFGLHHSIHRRPDMTSGRAGIVAAQNWALTAGTASHDGGQRKALELCAELPLSAR